MKDESRVEQGGNNGDNRNWLDSWYILKIELAGFPEGWEDEEYKRMREVKNWLQVAWPEQPEG